MTRGDFYPMSEFKKYKTKVMMKKPWIISDSWAGKPTNDNLLEMFIDELTNGNLGELFKITIEEVKEAEKDVGRDPKGEGGED